MVRSRTSRSRSLRLARRRPWSIRASAAAEESPGLPENCFSPHGVPNPKFFVGGPAWRVFDGRPERARITEHLFLPADEVANSRYQVIGAGVRHVYGPFGAQRLVFLAVQSIVSRAGLILSPRCSRLLCRTFSIYVFQILHWQHFPASLFCASLG
jgi:hypothetical protein